MSSPGGVAVLLATCPLTLVRATRAPRFFRQVRVLKHKGSRKYTLDKEATLDKIHHQVVTVNHSMYGLLLSLGNGLVTLLIDGVQTNLLWRRSKVATHLGSSESTLSLLYQ